MRSLWASTIAIIALSSHTLAEAALQEQCPYSIRYSTVQGYFLQDDPATDPKTFDYTATNFGLKNRSYPAVPDHGDALTQWQKFEKQVKHFNARAPSETKYKVLFMGRHGEGYHNAAQSYYGTPGWNCYWSLLNGNGTTTWNDADLTEGGIEQALIAHNFWSHEIAVEKIPVPQSYYTSPLTRCLRTANLTFNGLDLPRCHPFQPLIKELLREGISLHTCDHRRSKSYIHSLFPSWPFEPGFKENDKLWNGVTAETSDAQDARSKKWLDQVFSEDDSTWISITSHSGEIASTLRVLGHQEFGLNTGAVIPVLVKAEYLPRDDSSTSIQWTTSTHCAAPPKTSSSDVPQGCVCTGSAGPVTTPLVTVTNTNAGGPTTYPGRDC